MKVVDRVVESTECCCGSFSISSSAEMRAWKPDRTLEIWNALSSSVDHETEMAP